MLNTIEFGLIKIVDETVINPLYDTFLGFDLICEWAFYQLPNGEIVAVYIDD